MNNAISRAVLLTNLGSPSSTEVKDVRRFLNEFLMDKRVIDYPWLFRFLLVKGIIIQASVSNSAEAYKTIWIKEGSPLVVITEQLRDSLQKQLSEPVEIAMRYGVPSPEDAYNSLMRKYPELREVLILPLYPHYAMSSYETAILYAKEIHAKNNYPFRLKILKPFFDDEYYLEAMVENMRPFLKHEYDHILFSYHGIPERHIRKSDITGNHCLRDAACCETDSPAHTHCYRHQCLVTTKRIVEKAGIDSKSFSVSFQSRIGKHWLTPYTDIRLQQMPGEGIKKLLVICPAFVSDCLETLEEIAIRGKEIFLKAGGESFEMIPCMNTHPSWVNALAKWVNEYRQGNRNMLWEDDEQPQKQPSYSDR